MAIDLAEAKSRVWDNLIVGTGMGGSAIGYALAQGGQSVLFCEKGPDLDPHDPLLYRGGFAEDRFQNTTTADARQNILERSGREFEAIVDLSVGRSQNLYPILGRGVGGSTSLYGMVLERFFPEDFKPELFGKDNTESSAPNQWPIAYEDLLPYYLEAERLLGICGEVDFFKRDQVFDYRKPAALHPVNTQIVSSLTKKGLHPYLLAKGQENVSGCETCQGYLCNKQCKNDARKTFLVPALQNCDAQLLSGAEVLILRSSATTVDSALVKKGSELFELRAKRFILAGGALATPRLLLNSRSIDWPTGLGNRSQMVGRNLMRHLIDLYSLKLSSTLGNSGSLKEIGLNDFYQIEDLKFGNIQSFGRLPSADAILKDLTFKLKMNDQSISSALLSRMRPFLAPLVAKITRGSSLLAATLEDWPYLDNRVYLDSQGQLAIRYRIHPSEKKRLKLFRKMILQAMAEFEPRLLKLAHKNEMLGHACGTCRFGDDPLTSVLNSSNRVHDLENLYIVDASFFPTSGGTNPALTIAANALRVGETILRGVG